MAKHKCEFLSKCCDSEVLYGSAIDFDESGAVGVCSSCHEFTSLYEKEFHSPWDDDYKPTPIVPDHDGWLLCGECEEYCYEDARVEGGMKCGVCAYG
tara:strand:- start:48 stop:338 length:291 start_codon:yes stop_codon:yes gene_type:complete